jgi:hypothetical protein
MLPDSPMTHEERCAQIRRMSYRELQRELKSFDLAATGPRERLRERLIAWDAACRRPVSPVDPHGR